MKANKVVLPITFILIIFSLEVWLVLKPDTLVSFSERRKLTLLPKISIETIINGECFNKLEDYLLDQIPLRETFRRVKSINEFYVLKKLDNHKIIIKDGYATKISYPLSEKSSDLYVKKINQIQDKYLKDKDLNIYNLIIPDKNYYLINEGEYPLINYKELENKIKTKISGEYINIFDTLDLESYYKTDSHWKIENISGVANKILARMGRKEVKILSEKKISKPFYGVYYGESALPLKYDEISYVETDEINNTVVYRMNTKTKKLEKDKMYHEEVFDEELTDSYDFFLGGASTITVLENNLENSGKVLYIFSDSFGRSLAPLLISDYSKIVLYDIRYIKPSIALEQVRIENGNDVLFAYNISSIDVSSNINVD